MVSFSCDACQDTIKKPKLNQLYGRCRSSVTCIDCSKTFYNPHEFSSHDKCITEAEAYMGALYKPKSTKSQPLPTPSQPPNPSTDPHQQSKDDKRAGKAARKAAKLEASSSSKRKLPSQDTPTTTKKTKTTTPETPMTVATAAFDRLSGDGSAGVPLDRLLKEMRSVCGSRAMGKQLLSTIDVRRSRKSPSSLDVGFRL
ncbi:hypothetical protein PYCC9005_004887 [Savitreella phatthalungensis]